MTVREPNFKKMKHEITMVMSNYNPGLLLSTQVFMGNAHSEQSARSSRYRAVQIDRLRIQLHAHT
jgi:hypothetical protein